MATYDPITPPSLANLDTVIDHPADSEAANLLGKYDLQIKKFVYDFLSLVFDDSVTQPTLKSAAFTSTSLTNLVSGTNDNDGVTPIAIVHGTVATPDLKDLSVRTAKLDAQAVTADKIADLTITTGKINDAQVTGAKIANTTITAANLATDAVETAKIKDDAVTTAKILDANVTAAKILDHVVDGTKLAVGSAEGQLLVAGADPFHFAPKAVTGAIAIDKDGVTTLASSGVSVVAERTGISTTGGASVAVTWNVRGTAVAWVELYSSLTSSFVTIDGAKIKLSVGTYLVSASSPAYKVGLHQIVLLKLNSSDAYSAHYHGTAETAPLATVAAESYQTRSFVEAKVTIASGEYLLVHHYTTSANAVDGLGTPIGANFAYAGSTKDSYSIYAEVRIQKLS